VDNLNGYGYLLSNLQHPGAREDTVRCKSRLAADGKNIDILRTAIDKRGAVGYFGAWPAIKLVRDGHKSIK
jgi:hypothetical protein